MGDDTREGGDDEQGDPSNDPQNGGAIGWEKPPYFRPGIFCASCTKGKKPIISTLFEFARKKKIKNSSDSNGRKR